MGKGSRLRALRTTITNDSGKLTAPKDDGEMTIKSMGDITRIKAGELPSGTNRAQRRADERADRHEAALERNYPTNFVLWGRRVQQAFQRIRVAKHELGEAESIKKARDIDFRARRATMEVKWH